MKKNRCQANTRKNEPCKNYAIKGTDFCHVHTEHDIVFPPVQLTAYLCPYCEASLGENTRSCDICNESFLRCPYCDEPLRRDAKSCGFCKLDLAPVQPVHHDINTFIPVRTSHPAEGASLTFGILFIVPLILLIGLLYFVVTYLYSL